MSLRPSKQPQVVTNVLGLEHVLSIGMDGEGRSNRMNRMTRMNPGRRATPSQNFHFVGNQYGEPDKTVKAMTDITDEALNRIKNTTQTLKLSMYDGDGYIAHAPTLYAQFPQILSKLRELPYEFIVFKKKPFPNLNPIAGMLIPTALKGYDNVYFIVKKDWVSMGSPASDIGAPTERDLLRDDKPVLPRRERSTNDANAEEEEEDDDKASNVFYTSLPLQPTLYLVGKNYPGDPNDKKRMKTIITRTQLLDLPDQRTALKLSPRDGDGFVGHMMQLPPWNYELELYAFVKNPIEELVPLDDIPDPSKNKDHPYAYGIIEEDAE